MAALAAAAAAEAVAPCDGGGGELLAVGASWLWWPKMAARCVCWRRMVEKRLTKDELCLKLIEVD